jgi:UDP-2,3-diacylglucosamine hydrolase
MMQSAYFIADLHLDSEDLENHTAFFYFLQHTAPKAQALYILGDLFDFWIGDDNLSTPFHQRIVQALSQLAAQGTQIFYMQGNRDFLARHRFAQAAHLTLLADPTIVTIADRSLLLSHGDLLCTKDKNYLKLRTIVHHPVIQWVFLALPKSWRQQIARHIQKKGRQQAGYKMAYTLDVTEEAVQHWLQRYQSTVLIHGHTHRPAKHLYPNGATRWVLPDWSKGKGGYLHIDAHGINLMTLQHTDFTHAPRGK